MNIPNFLTILRLFFPIFIGIICYLKLVGLVGPSQRFEHISSKIIWISWTLPAF